MADETERVDAEAVAAALQGTRFSSIRWVEETGSTNADLAGEARQGASEQVLVTDLQTAGRGRRNRVWDAPAGSSVLMSVLLRDGLAPSPFWSVGAVALAAAQAAGERTEVPVSLKWPNDVLIGDAKLAGVLSEIVDGAVIVGIGINVNWTAAMVEQFDGRATAINQHSVEVVDRGRLVVDLLQRLESLLGLDIDQLRRLWIDHCATIGRRVRVVRDDGDAIGDAIGVRPDGALLVANGGDTTAHSVGDVTHLRPM